MSTDRTTSGEMTAIFSESKVGEYVIKPWTVKQVVRLAPLLGEIVITLKERGIDLAKFDDTDLEKEINLETLSGAINGIIEKVPPVIAISLNKELSEVEEMDWGLATTIGAQILSLNWNHIKNLWGLMMKNQTGGENQPPQTLSH